MAWKKVENYWLGYSYPKRSLYFCYRLAGETITYQFLPSTEEFIALADMFRNGGAMSYNLISYDTEGKYFVTAPEEDRRGGDTAMTTSPTASGLLSLS